MKQQSGGATAGTAAVTMFAAPSYEVLLAGRLLYGLGIGFAMHAAPAYIAEVVPPPAPAPTLRP